MKKILIILAALVLICLCGCSSRDSDAGVSPSDVSATDVSTSDAPQFDEAQLRVADMLSENAKALMNGETQMYMMAIAYQSEQYEATQQYVLELCANYDISIELEFLSIDISGDNAEVTVNQLTTLTPKDGGAPVTYEALLRHDMICRADIWNILYTYCESTVIRHDPDTLMKPIRDGIIALEQGDADGYMRTISPDSRTYADTAHNLQLTLKFYQTQITLDSYEIVDYTNSTATIRTLQTTGFTSILYGDTSVYSDCILHKLICSDGVWYIDSSTSESSLLISGPGIEQ